MWHVFKSKRQSITVKYIVKKGKNTQYTVKAGKNENEMVKEYN